MSLVDWSKLSEDEIVRSVRAAPPIASAWEDCNDMGGGVRLTKEGVWKRTKRFPGDGWMHAAFVQPSSPGPGWLWSCGFSEGGFALTKEAAMAAADDHLLKLGWRLEAKWTSCG